MSQQDISRVDNWAVRISNWPRIVRIIVAGGGAVLLAAFTSQFLSLLLGTEALYDTTTATAVFIAAGGVGLVAYIFGWWSLVSFDRAPEFKAQPRAVYFVLVCALVTLALLVWLAISVVIAALPPEIPV